MMRSNGELLGIGSAGVWEPREESRWGSLLLCAVYLLNWRLGLGALPVGTFVVAKFAGHATRHAVFVSALCYFL